MQTLKWSVLLLFCLLQRPASAQIEYFLDTNGRYGYAAAIAWTLFLITVVIALVNFLLVRRIRGADD